MSEPIRSTARDFARSPNRDRLTFQQAFDSLVELFAFRYGLVIGGQLYRRIRIRIDQGVSPTTASIEATVQFSTTWIPTTSPLPAAQIVSQTSNFPINSRPNSNLILEVGEAHVVTGVDNPDGFSVNKCRVTAEDPVAFAPLRDEVYTCVGGLEFKDRYARRFEMNGTDWVLISDAFSEPVFNPNFPTNPAVAHMTRGVFLGIDSASGGTVTILPPGQGYADGLGLNLFGARVVILLRKLSFKSSIPSHLWTLRHPVQALADPLFSTQSPPYTELQCQTGASIVLPPEADLLTINPCQMPNAPTVQALGQSRYAYPRSIIPSNVGIQPTCFTR